MKKYFNKEVQISLVAIMALVILFFGMQFLKGQSLLSVNNNYKVHFSDVTGLTPASIVYANGYKVGVVEKIDYDFNRPNDIVALVGITKELKLPEGTTAEITSDFLGNVRLELHIGEGPNFLSEGASINGKQQIGILSKAADMVPQVERMLPKLDSILTSINTLLADPSISQSVHNVEDITASLTTTSNELQQLTTQLHQQLPTMMGKADNVLTNTETLTKNLRDIDVAATMASVNATLANVEQMTARLNSKDGTLGLLMSDPQLYLNLSSTLGHTDSLVMDLKNHPKRYVHFSIFGKKDK